jgi:hypothetical protein
MDLNLKGTFSELRVANSSQSSGFKDNRKVHKTKLLNIYVPMIPFSFER